MALFSAIATSAAPTAGSAPAAQVADYRPVFQACRRPDGAVRLAIRRMTLDGTATLLAVDPATLATSLERDADWSCADTTDAAQGGTRYIRAVAASCTPHGTGAALPGVIADGGLVKGQAAGAFITGDLCPSRRPLDRRFLQRLERPGAPLPLALSISGLWLARHGADFQWLRAGERSGAFRITWVDHSYHHPYIPGRTYADNFLLTRGVDMRAEILDTEKLLIANGETPSVFFRFPGLISSPSLMQTGRAFHLIVLGADAWLAKSPRARPGDIILIHLNGNEPAGLKVFDDLLAARKLPQPFRPIDEAP